MTTFISFTGNLAKAPELRTDKNGRPYTFARVIRTDRVNVAGEELLDTYTNDEGNTRTVRKVLDAEVTVSLRGQTVTVERRN